MLDRENNLFTFRFNFPTMSACQQLLHASSCLPQHPFTGGQQLLRLYGFWPFLHFKACLSPKPELTSKTVSSTYRWHQSGNSALLRWALKLHRNPNNKNKQPGTLWCWILLRQLFSNIKKNGPDSCTSPGSITLKDPRTRRPFSEHNKRQILGPALAASHSAPHSSPLSVLYKVIYYSYATVLYS